MIPDKKTLLKELGKDEKIDGCPTCDGLRRLVEKYVGTIVTKDIEVPHFDTGSPKPTAVVQVRISVWTKDEEGKDTCLLHSDVADCGMYNTDPPFDNYPTATAATRAEGRIYRKMLGLTGVVSYEEIGLCGKEKRSTKKEEVSIDEPQQFVPITNPQKKAIEILCRRANIQLEQFVNNKTNKSLEALSENEGAELIKELNTTIKV